MIGQPKISFSITTVFVLIAAKTRIDGAIDDIANLFLTVAASEMIMTIKGKNSAKFPYHRKKRSQRDRVAIPSNTFLCSGCTSKIEKKDKVGETK